MSAARRPRPPATMADFDHVPGSGELKLEDHRRWPLSRVALYCADCGWARDYNPDAVARRLRELQSGGYRASVRDVARRVAWPCPACHRVNWASTLAYPKSLDRREVERAARQIRS
jgi:hypothetical protein